MVSDYHVMVVLNNKPVHGLNALTDCSEKDKSQLDSDALDSQSCSWIKPSTLYITHIIEGKHIF